VRPGRRGIQALEKPFQYRDLVTGGAGQRRAARKIRPVHYLAFVFVTAALAAAQFYFLPRNLGPLEFAGVVLGLSVIQGALQFGDLGSYNASLRAALPAQDRVELRESAVFLSSVVCLIGVVLGVLVGLTSNPMGWILAAGCATAFLLAPNKAHSSGAIQLGEERIATKHNLVWQNAPKLGSIVGSFGGSAVASMAGALVSAAFSYRLELPRFVSWRVLRTHAKVIIPGFVLSLSAFLMAWTDTYALSTVAGLEDAGQYQAVVRPLTGITYLYLPIVSLIQAAHNAGLKRRERRLMVVAVALGFLGAGAISGGMWLFGPTIWPEFEFALPVILACGFSASLFALCTVVGGQLTLRGKQGLAAGTTVLGALVLLGLSLVLIPRFGAFGAGLASASSWLFVTICHSAILAVVVLRQRAEKKEADESH